MSTILLFLLILACPLMMIFMMRGHGHGHGGHGGHGGHDQTDGANSQGDGKPGHVHDEHCRHDDESLDDLKRSRDKLDAEIEERERAVEALPR